MNTKKQLDKVDCLLIQALTEDARTAIAELARTIGMSAPSVTERIRRLEEAGVISGYKAQVNPEALGYYISAYVRIRPMAGKLAKVVELLPQLKEIVFCDRVTGEDCFIARVHVTSMANLETLIDKLMPFAQTNTSIVQSSPVAQRLLPLMQNG